MDGDEETAGDAPPPGVWREEMEAWGWEGLAHEVTRCVPFEDLRAILKAGGIPALLDCWRASHLGGRQQGGEG